MPALLQNTLMSLGAFIVVLSIVVFVHEYGHFRAARWRKVAVDTFSIGFGKTLFGWRDKAGVEWKVGALPLGGYVKFADDQDAVSSAPREIIDDPAAKAEARRKGLFHAQPLLTRSIVVLAGPISNFIFAIAAFAVAISIIGRDATDIDKIPARVAEVAPHTAAASAGLREGDVIRAVNGHAIANFRDLQQAIAASALHPMTLQVERGGARLSITATPRPLAQGDDQGHRAGQGVLGVRGPEVLPQERVVIRYNPIQAIGVGAQQTWAIVSMTATYVADVVTGKASGRLIAGPAGIFMESGRVASTALEISDSNHRPPTILQRLGNLALALLQWAAIVSVAVGIVNLLPIPILDGGHLLFYVIEALRGGKPLPPVAQEWAYRAGFAVMASLFLFATWNDITRSLPGSPG